jgi:hypothetical protein
MAQQKPVVNRHVEDDQSSAPRGLKLPDTRESLLLRVGDPANAEARWTTRP